ncbi:MAG TPA: hypothetical protein VHR66_08045 [Gemmataceae bacterium]|nr:hypothetical protein [Gemmataceae bacterium]
MAPASEIVVRHEYDRKPVWDRIRGRKSVFLDTNVWIDMADGKLDAAKPIREKLTELVGAGVLFCPLSRTIIWELFKQAKDSRLRTGGLMESLSLNACFTRPEEIFAWEFSVFLKRLASRCDEQCERHMLFVPVLGHLTSSCSLKYAADSPADYVRESSKIIFDALSRMSLTDLLKLDTEVISEFLRAAPAPPYQREAEFFRAFAKGDRDKVWTYEAAVVSKNVVEPIIKNLSASDVVTLHAFIGTAPKDKYGGILPTLMPRLPAVCNHVDVMALASEDPNRKDRPSDFYDLDMLPVPLAYADVFVSRDRRIRDMLQNRGKLLHRNRCQFFSDYAAFGDWLGNAGIA